MAIYKAPEDKNNRGASRYKTPEDNAKSQKKAIKASRHNSSNKKQPKKKKARYGFITAIIIILIAACACIIGWLIIRGQEQSGNVIEPTQTVTEAATTALLHNVEKIDLPALTSDDGSDGYLDGAVYIWKNKGFEVFKGNVKTAVSYANSISNYKTALGAGTTVYSMVVSNNTEFGLPERISKDVSNNQRENTEAIITNLSDDVIDVDIYNILGEHRNDNLFYNTDNSWTNEGAYYAYSVFSRKAGFEPHEITKFKENSVNHKFAGDYINATISQETKNGNPNLLKNLDAVNYYSLPKDVTVTGLKAGDAEESELSFYNSDTTEEDSPKAIFNTANTAYAKISNPSINDDSKIAIVKDSYGEALAPLLSYHYSEVHLIDLSNFKRNLKTYCNDNNITEVLFVNGIMSANSAAQVAKLDSMFE